MNADDSDPLHPPSGAPAFGKPLVVLVPEYDDYLRPDEARAVRPGAAG